MYIFTRIVGMLPTKLQDKAKAFIPAFGALATAGITWATTGTLDHDAIKVAEGLFVAATAAFIFPNLGYKA